jgi:hypothetical protein
MRNNIIKIIILSFILVLFFLFYSGCVNVVSNIPSNPESDLPANNIGPTSGGIIIENGAEITKDCTPTLTVSSEEAAYMSFSGDGNSWTDWISYNSSYEEFNIANGFYGTIFSSGEKNVYVRFKDSEGNLSPIDEIAFNSIQYEMQDLYFIKIIPQNITISVGDSFTFTVHAYDFGGKNEVPIGGSKVTWTKCCGVGELSPTTGLSTTYTPPPIVSERNITAHYENLATGAIILVTK